MTDPSERAMFLAQTAHESGHFRSVRENLRYRSARLLAMFPRRFTSLADATAVCEGGEAAIAERIYGGRLGNTLSGDGARFIGRGYLQITGRDNYRRAGRALGLDLLAHPEMVEIPEVAIATAWWYWSERHSSGSNSLRGFAQAGDVRRVTALINGGNNGLAERERLYRHYFNRIVSEPTLPTRLP
ncbi:glycoside hydrolase family 19 protein [Derxia gummosa]|uniref:Glycoside hydrolase family 19 protein n=1 Tax=Derxia gummosa DSM 723 TaxID=1121388 RepID=A0A8B6XD61_9BURK|nr:glycoside hydrolase family 19 protein [Derxia gummosa]